MEWWEQELAFERKWNKGTVDCDIWKYIPKRKYVAVDDANVDSDGYWVYLNEGWDVDGERTIHCYSVKDLKECIKCIRSCK